MAVHQMIILRFTPKQIRAAPAQVIADIRRTLDAARGRAPLNLRTLPAAEAAPAACAPSPPPKPPPPPEAAPAA
jgi:hypothetical protein